MRARVVMCAVIASLVGVADAQACTAAQSTQLRQARAVAAQLAAAQKPGAADAVAVAGRAAARCGSAPFAIAVSQLTAQRGEAVAGQAYAFGPLVLRGSGDRRYRLDVRASIVAWRQLSPGPRADAVYAAIHGVAFRTRATATWSADPTLLTFDPELQAGVAATWAAGAGSRQRWQAAATLAVFAQDARRRQVHALPLLRSLSVVVSADRAAVRLGTTSALQVANRLRAPIVAAVHAADTGAWSRIRGAYATLAEHRRLARLAQDAAAVRTDRKLAARAARLASYLTTPPRLSFRQLPVRPFYPWPRDGAFDAQAVSVQLDKPSSVELTIYGPGGTAVRQHSASALPGLWVGRWDGTAESGATLGEGEYRYAVTAVDRAGNARALPGLASFRIARDRTPPVVAVARVQHVAGSRRRTLRATWRVREPISPRVSVSVLVRQGTDLRVVPIAGRAHRASTLVSLRLRPGRWRTAIKVVDGSGNIRIAPAGMLYLR